MDQARFRDLAQQHGYGDAQLKDYPADNDGALHTHDFSVMLLVLEGDFRLGFENDTRHYAPGEVCELPAGVRHIERTGPTGARILLAKRALVDAPVVD